MERRAVGGDAVSTGATGLIARLVAAVSPPGHSTSFGPRPVEAQEELALLAAARVAPSADNAQTWRFVSVRTAATRARLAAAVEPALQQALSEAPLVLVVCGVSWLVTRARREQPFVMLDVPIALTHVLLEAAELGLQCAWTLDLDEAALREALEIPPDVRVIAALGLGWPA